MFCNFYEIRTIGNIGRIHFRFAIHSYRSPTVHRLLYFHPLFYKERKSELFLQINRNFCFQIERRILKTVISKWTCQFDFSFIDKKGSIKLVKPQKNKQMKNRKTATHISPPRGQRGCFALLYVFCNASKHFNIFLKSPIQEMNRRH